MKTDPIELARRFARSLDAKDYASAAECLAPSCQYEMRGQIHKGPELAGKMWPRNYNAFLAGEALSRTMNISAWDGARLVGTVRVLSDGYFFNTVPEVMVDADYQRQGIGRELMRRALSAAPGRTLFLGAQPGNEGFFGYCQVGLLAGRVGP